MSTLEVLSGVLQANIRSKIKAKKIDGYQRRKYIAKTMYMFMLGYEVDFGCKFPLRVRLVRLTIFLQLLRL
jgi:hypothetical protein